MEIVEGVLPDGQHERRREVSHLLSRRDSFEVLPEREKTMQPKLATCYIVLRTSFWTGKEPL